MNWSALSWFAMKPVQVVRGAVRERTKLEASDLPLTNAIVVLEGGDLEEALALEWVKRNVLAVVHCGMLMSGERPTQGPLVLLQHGIPIWETDAANYTLLASQEELSIYPDLMLVGEQTLPCKAFTQTDWLQAQQQMNEPLAQRWETFIDRTLARASLEKAAVVQPFPQLLLQTEMADKPVLLVAGLVEEGQERVRILRSIKRLIAEHQPVVIGIGQGADQMLREGIVPDVIVAAAAQLTTGLLTSGAEIVVHIDEHGDTAQAGELARAGRVHKLPCAASTSDAALLLAYHHRAASLITAGLPLDLADWVQQGSEDMGSALLVRLQIGARLIDVRSVPLPGGSRWTKEALTTALVSGLFIGFAMLQLHWIVNRAAHAVWRIGFGG
ncbi:putative cytokinetic ring protein SteA [Paenibacillus oryzisoli]|uniref:putative cytokinetic ring protein SteA n=1 Tax=Paenibacillus oryzisoli TaxID=1850517 RepID=UPI003D28FE74